MAKAFFKMSRSRSVRRSCSSSCRTLIPKAEAGRYMGVSNIATASAGLIARPILGPIIDAFNNNRTSTVGYRVMFGIVTLFYLVAFVTLRPVREIKVD